MMQIIAPIILLALKPIDFVNDNMNLLWFLSIPIVSFSAIFLSLKWFRMPLNLKWEPINFSIILVCLVLVLSINVFQTSLDITFFKYLIQDQLRFLRLNVFFENNFYFYLNFVVVVLLGPITEEILYRRILLVKLLEDYKPSIAILITTVLFALMHFDLQGIISYLFGGFVYTYIFYLTRNIWFSIILHSVFNFITFFTKIGVHNKSDSFFNIGLLIYVLLLFLIVFLIKKLIAYSKTIKEIKEFE